MISVLFVCTGNICRSPTAEGVFRELVRQAGLEHAYQIDSAGMISYHTGEAPDPRTRRTARTRGYDLDGQKARQVTHSDFERFDHILAMDGSHYDDLMAMADSSHHHKIKMFLSFLPNAPVADVPDPYYGGPEGFENTFQLIEDGSKALLTHLGKTSAS